MSVNKNPALIFSNIMQQVGAISLLAGIYNLAFRGKKTKNAPSAPKSKTASGYFLTAFNLFMQANTLNRLFPAPSMTAPNGTAAPKPKGP